MHPPSKDLSFNKHLVRQDGLLVDQPCGAEGLDFQQAKTRIEEEVTEWEREAATARASGSASSRHVLLRDHEQQLQFEPDRRVNFLKDAYGLRPAGGGAIVRLEHSAKAAAVPLAEPGSHTKKVGGPRPSWPQRPPSPSC